VPSLLDRNRVLCCLVLLALLRPAAVPAEVSAPAKPATLSQKIESILKSDGARRGHWGIEVARLSDGKVLYTRQAEQLYLPASNMKLFTTAVALEKLGPNFRFRTTVEADGSPDAAGRIQDLYLVGRGDPMMGHRILPDERSVENFGPPEAALQALADQVASKGVREVGGNLIADDTHFIFEPFSRGWEEDDLVYGYAAPVTALAFNDSALLLRATPGPEPGATAQITLQPFSDYFTVNNRLVTTAGGPWRVRLRREAGSRQLDVWGEVPVGPVLDEDGVAIDDPSRWAAEVFRKALEERGIRVAGHVEVLRISRAEAAAPGFVHAAPSRIVLAERLSAPLTEDIRIINKYSHNLHVEMLLRTLGKEVKGLGSARSGIEVIENFVRDLGIKDDEAVFSDGSGLSRHSIITPRAIIRLLRHMARSPRFAAFLDSLPVAGEHGTLDDRFLRSVVRGRVRAKTGTLEHVNALSGYMDLPSGERLVFSIMGNEHPMRASQGKRVVDRITVAIYEHFSARAEPKRP
jgi:D-alanyl-D-alanine carboxypeptidase/D-alanyl-D-alanine-endopeptidase (penicillin-binding protein 4)